jgi:hypothetical protein
VTATAPDYIEPVVGWRIWYATSARGMLLLESVIYRTRWPQHDPLVARCSCLRLPIWPFTRRERHEAPAEACRCGIHAALLPVVSAYLPDRLGFTDLIPVVGRVSLWGVVHEHKRGWRASLAYPERLFVPTLSLSSSQATRVLAGLAGYGVPVTAVDGATSDDVIAAVTEEVVGVPA